MEDDARMVIALMHKLEGKRRALIMGATKNAEIHRGQFPIIEFITRHDMCTQAQAAEGLGVSDASVACSVRRMLSSGLIERMADESDSRCYRLTVTERGRRAAEAIKRAFDTMDAAMFADFSHEDAEALAALLRRMEKNLSSADAELFAIAETENKGDMEE